MHKFQCFYATFRGCSARIDSIHSLVLEMILYFIQKISPIFDYHRVLQRRRCVCRRRAIDGPPSPILTCYHLFTSSSLSLSFRVYGLRIIYVIATKYCDVMYR